MIQIRKFVLVILIAALILLGCIGGFFACMYMEDSGGMVRISRSDYDGLVDIARKYAKADSLKDYIDERFYQPVPEEDLTEGMYYGMFEALDDRYSAYMNSSEYEQLTISTTGDYSGVGITMSVTEDGRFVYAAALTEDAPAWDSGIMVGDIIWKVDGVEYSGSQLDICAANVRGEAGTKVVLTIVRGEQILDFTLTRARILSKTVSSRMLDGGIGYISISNFENPTYDDFMKALKEIEGQGARGLVIDLRDNGGGLVTSCIKVADELMDKGTVVYTEDRNGNRDYYTTEDGRTKLPYVILINGYTASASEIMAAGIQDNGEGLIVGSKSYGKGIIQEVKALADGSAVKLTIMQYFSPNGSVIHKVGITPDYVVDLTEDCYDEQGWLVDDRQLDKAVDLLKKMK